MKKCSNCGNEILEKAVCCPYCGASQEAGEHAESKTENADKVRYCSKCGEKLKAGYSFCPVCGKTVSDTSSNLNHEKEKPHNSVNIKEEPEIRQNTGNNISDIAENIEGKIKSISGEYPKGMLKVFCIIAGVLYGYWTLTYLPYLSYYAMADKAWGFFMILACAWSCAIFFVIAFKCRKQYGLQLSYMIFGGAILKSILHLISIQRLASYQYWKNSFSNYWPVIIALLIALVCYYFMKKEEMLEIPENTTFVENVKQIPDVLRAVLVKDGVMEHGSNQGRTKAEKPKKPVAQPGSEAEKAIFVVNSVIFLMFSVFYTIELVYNLFSAFSPFTLFTSLFTILTCIAIWMIYCNSRQGVLDAAGFTLVYGINAFRIVVRVIIYILLMIAAIGADLGMLAYLLVFIIAALDIGYLCSIGSIFGRMKANAKGQRVEITAGIYPLFILCIKTLIKFGMLGWAIFLQSTANEIINTLNQYGNTTSSLVGEISSYLGLGYGYGYSQSSSVIQSFLNPVIEWIQNTLGYSRNFIIMLIAVALPVLEILLLVKVRSYMHTGSQSGELS